MLLDDAGVTSASRAEKSWDPTAREQHEVMGLDEVAVSLQSVFDGKACPWAGPPHGLSFADWCLGPEKASLANPVVSNRDEVVLLRGHFSLPGSSGLGPSRKCQPLLSAGHWHP